MFSRFSANGVQSGCLLAPQFPVSNHFGLANLGTALSVFPKGERGRDRIFYVCYKNIAAVTGSDLFCCCFCSGVFSPCRSSLYLLVMVSFKQKKNYVSTLLGKAEHGNQPMLFCLVDSLILLEKLRTNASFKLPKPAEV